MECSRAVRNRVHDVGRILAVAKDPLPDLECKEQPQTVAMIGARLVLEDELLQRVGIEPAARPPARAQDELVDESAEWPSKPRAHGDWKSHLSSGQNFPRQEITYRLAEDRLGLPPSQLQPPRQRHDMFHELVVQERHATLDRGRHAHLVLLHEQLV
jgi:hypothetical protein